MYKMKPNDRGEKFIFLSYPHKNNGQAAVIIEALQKAGYRVWFDEGLELGQRYNQVIAEHIEECEVFMCLLTKEYYESDYCRMEFNFALEDCRKEIIPVFIDDYIKVRKTFPAGMRMFLSGVNAFIMNERMDMERFMRKVASTAILEPCREAVGSSVRDKIPEWLMRLKDARVKDTVKFGSYWQDVEGKEKTLVEWIVLDKQGDKALLVSKYALDARPYNEKRGDANWDQCTLREWLNERFFIEAFTKDERKLIETTYLKTERNPEYPKINPGNDRYDRVFLLSLGEAERYFDSNEERQCIPTAYAREMIRRGVEKERKKVSLGEWSYAGGVEDFNKDSDAYLEWLNRGKTCWWWLRSPGRASFYSALISRDGSFDFDGCWVDDGLTAVRPGLCIHL